MVLMRVLKDNHDAWSINYSLFSLKRRKKRKKHEFLELEIKKGTFNFLKMEVVPLAIYYDHHQTRPNGLISTEAIEIRWSS